MLERERPESANRPGPRFYESIGWDRRLLGVCYLDELEPGHVTAQRRLGP
jgi:hypothetical protein